MPIAEIAKAFGMNIGEMAEYIGYSRQALYNKSFAKSGVRFNAAVRALKELNNNLYLNETEVAHQNFEARENAIKTLEKMAVKEGDNE